MTEWLSISAYHFVINFMLDFFLCVCVCDFLVTLVFYTYWILKSKTIHFIKPHFGRVILLIEMYKLFTSFRWNKFRKFCCRKYFNFDSNVFYSKACHRINDHTILINLSLSIRWMWFLLEKCQYHTYTSL